MEKKGIDNLVNKHYSNHNNLKSSKSVKDNFILLYAYPILGLLPAQDYLENKIKNYSRRSAVLPSCLVEGLAGFGAVCLGSSFEIGFALCIDAQVRLSMRSFTGGIGEDGKFKEENPKAYCGVLFLEIPYRIMKGAYKGLTYLLNKKQDNAQGLN